LYVASSLLFANLLVAPPLKGKKYRKERKRKQRENKDGDTSLLTTFSLEHKSALTKEYLLSSEPIVFSVIFFFLTTDNLFYSYVIANATETSFASMYQTAYSFIRAEMEV